MGFFVSVMAAKMPSKLLDRPAHLLFYPSHAQPRLFRDFRVTIAVEPASEKYLSRKRLQTKDGLFDPCKPVARLQRGHRIAVADIDIVDGHMLGLRGAPGGASMVQQKIVRRLAQIGTRCVERDRLLSLARDEADEYLLDDILGAILSGAAVQEPQQTRSLGAIERVRNHHGRHPVMVGWQRVALLQR